MASIIIGSILIFFQIISYIGSLYSTGLSFFQSFTLYEIVYFLSYNFFGIIGSVCLIIGIRSKLKGRPNKEQADIDVPLSEVTQDTVPDVATTNEIASETIVQKPHRKFCHNQELTFFGKMCFFLLLHKKKIFLSTLASAVSIFASVIAFYICDEAEFFEFCANVFLILTLIFAFISLMTLLIMLVENIKKVNTSTTTIHNEQHHPRKNKFCKYCGTQIDADSIFCPSCGQKLD